MKDFSFSTINAILFLSKHQIGFYKMKLKYYGFKHVNGPSVEEVKFKGKNYMIINRQHVCSNDDKFIAADDLTKKRILSKLRGKGYAKNKDQTRINSYSDNVAGAMCLAGCSMVRWFFK